MTTRGLAMSEKQLQAIVLKYARLHNWLAYHTFDSRRSAPGFPDLCMVRSGRLVFAELKRWRGRLTSAQEAWGARLVKTDAEYYVWYPGDWHSGDIEEVLR